eukprot:7830282-Ditylum_brightwellii.AAC.1
MHSHECTALANYVNNSKDLLTTLFRNTPPPNQKFLMKYLDGPKSRSGSGGSRLFSLMYLPYTHAQ